MLVKKVLKNTDLKGLLYEKKIVRGKGLVCSARDSPVNEAATPLLGKTFLKGVKIGAPQLEPKSKELLQTLITGSGIKKVP
jgi:hypothetical protein